MSMDTQLEVIFNVAKGWEKRALEAEALVERIKQARADHPICEIHSDDEVSCGWRSTVLDIDTVLRGDDR